MQRAAENLPIPVMVIGSAVVEPASPAPTATPPGTVPATLNASDQVPPDPSHRILHGIDWSVTALALIAAVVGAIRFLRPGAGAGRMIDGPSRRNRLGEESVLLAVAAYLLGAGVVSVAVTAYGGEPSTWVSLAVDFGARAAGGSVCLLAAARWYEGGVWRFLCGAGVTPAGRVVRMTFVWTLLAVGVAPWIGQATVRAMELLWPLYQPAAHPTISRLGDEAGNLAVVAALWISAAVVTPVAEEIFFRGVLQTVLVNMTMRRGLAVLCASLAFGFVHLGQPFAIPALIFVGVCAGIVYERSGSLAAPICLHAIFNLKTLTWHWLTT